MQQKKKIGFDFSEANTKLCLSLHCNSNNSNLHVNKTEVCKSAAHDDIRWYEFYLGSVWKDFTKNEQSEISLNSIV